MCVHTLNAALEFFKSEKVPVILSDIRLPDGLGSELLKLKKDLPNLKIFFMSGESPQSKEELISKGAEKFYKKPFDFDLFINELNITFRQT